jgi:hypothetical protein
VVDALRGRKEIAMSPERVLVIAILVVLLIFAITRLT